MKYDDCAIERLEDRLLELFMRKSTPQKYSVVMLEATETIRQLKKQASAPPNDPLTLEQLREMDGEPVWVEALDYGVSRWAFVAADCEVVRYFTTRSNVACDVIARQFKTYGKTWLAYRRKPEEENSGF